VLSPIDFVILDGNHASFNESLLRLTYSSREEILSKRISLLEIAGNHIPTLSALSHCWNRLMNGQPVCQLINYAISKSAQHNPKTLGMLRQTVLWMSFETDNQGNQRAVALHYLMFTLDRLPKWHPSLPKFVRDAPFTTASHMQHELFMWEQSPTADCVDFGSKIPYPYCPALCQS
jgi:hypothetical protein